MLIIEGTDNVGKSTLVTDVIRHLNAMGLPHIPFHLSKLPDSFDHVQGYVELLNTNTVWDRFHISRTCYGAVCKNQREFTTAEAEILQAHLTLKGAYVVSCVVEDAAWIRKRWGSKDEMYDVETAVQVNESYKHQRQFRVDYKILVDVEGYPSSFANQIADRYVKHLDSMGLMP